jgi:hypothetical protein
MLRYLTFVLMTALLLISSGCQPVKLPEYTYVPPEAKADKTCAIRCTSAKRYCEQICRMKNPRCFEREEQIAMLQYNFYRLEAMREGMQTTKTIKDFNHHDRCLSSCQCTSSFNTCYVACGGQVTRLG